MRDRLEALVSLLIEKGGSDIHVQPEGTAKLRVHGIIEDTGIELQGKDLVEVFKREYLSRGRAEKLEADLASRGDADFAVSVRGKRFRVNVAKVYSSGEEDSYYVVMREINETPPLLEDLGFPERVFKGIVERVVYPASSGEKVSGLFLVIGETGSGKSTTLAAIIRKILERGPVNVITLEDPIEYVHKNGKGIINQRELATHFPSYPAGIRTALREDPNVILLGEIRDSETLMGVLDAAEAGHVVMGTLHATDTVTAINRLAFLAPEGVREFVRYRLSQVVIGFLAQKLVRVEEGKRKLLCEALFFNAGIKNLMVDPDADKQIMSLIDSTKHSQSFETQLFCWLKDGIVDYPKAMALAVRKDNFERSVDSAIKKGELPASIKTEIALDDVGSDGSNKEKKGKEMEL